MIPLYLDVLLKLKIVDIFGKIPVIKKNNINFLQYKYIVTDTKNHNNNLIGKVGYNKYVFYYIHIELIEKYEKKDLGIPICSHISICPFCFGIQLDIDEQYKYYDMIKNKDTNESDMPDTIYNLLKDKFCFELVKKL